MSADCEACAKHDRAAREAAVHRTIDGDQYALVAVRLGVPKECISQWTRDWTYRRNTWNGLDLTDEEKSRGWKLSRPDSLNEIGYVMHPQRAPKKTPLFSFLKLITNHKPATTEQLERAYAAMDAPDRQRLAPAFDLIMERMQFLAVAEQRLDLARRLVSSELQEIA